MKRRNFILSAGALGAVPLVLYGNDQDGGAGREHDREYLEIIKFHLHVGSKKDLVQDFYRDVAIPALNRTGLSRIGVLQVKYGPNQPTLYVIIPHPSLDSVVQTPEKLLSDNTYMQDGKSFLTMPLSDTAYIRMEKSLLVTFKNMPKLEAPTALLNNDARIFEIRIYESHNLEAGKRKIEMFNKGGEIEIFRKTGLQPVFFAETLIGPQIPNLTYMLVFENMAARDKCWDTFRDHPDWLKLKQDTYYNDTVSNITDIILRPASCSQI